MHTPNLWPLEETHNNAANRVLNQPISYRAGRQEHVNVPLHTSNLELWFRIIDIRRP